MAAYNKQSLSAFEHFQTLNALKMSEEQAKSSFIHTKI
jgi:hypothetical protein